MRREGEWLSMPANLARSPSAAEQWRPEIISFFMDDISPQKMTRETATATQDSATSARNVPVLEVTFGTSGRGLPSSHSFMGDVV